MSIIPANTIYFWGINTGTHFNVILYDMLYSLGLDLGKIYELSINSMLISFHKITNRPKRSHTTGANSTKPKIILKQI
jgi:hypothetical protein